MIGPPLCLTYDAIKMVVTPGSLPDYQKFNAIVVQKMDFRKGLYLMRGVVGQQFNLASACPELRLNSQIGEFVHGSFVPVTFKYSMNSSPCLAILRVGFA